MSRKTEPIKRILELYRDLNDTEKQACLAAMAVFGGAPAKPERIRKPKAAPQSGGAA